MSASYPRAIKVFTAKHDYTDDVMAAHVNDLQDEVVALETILGVNPNLLDSDDLEPMASLAARLSALESGRTIPAFDMWENTIQSVAKDVVQYVPFPTPLPNNDPFHWYNGVNGFRVNKTGWYHINGYTIWRANGDDGFRRLGIYANTRLLASSDFQGTLTYTFEASVCSIGVLTAGTQVRLGAYRTSSAAQTTGGSRISGVFLRGI